ncbi:DNA modification methylase [Labilithrix luteola]|uniref:DNA modification methylase n=1 Tax=Labilithrix luteola TaxID=1391654 RepID=A0A0K1PY76_9BACT|nr:DNA modification methylase [Labilithrix luteola]
MLASVRDHPSHRSKGYYLRNLLQYFNDADESLAEIRRTLTARGQALLVLQSSYYKEHELDLAALFADIAREMGLSAEIMFRMPVRRVMTSLNSKSRRYLDTRSYTESLLRLRRH